MAEVRQVPLEEYESMKKSYGLSDEQMRSIMNVEPLKTRWADGYGESRKKEEEVSAKERHQQLVDEIRSRLEKSKSEEWVEENKKVEEKTVTAHEVKVEEKTDTIENVEPVQPKTEEVSASAQVQPELQPVEEVPSFSEPVQTESFESVPNFEEPKAEEVPNFAMPQMEAEEEATPAFDIPQMDDVPSFAMPTEDVDTVVPENADVPEFSVPPMDFSAGDEKADEENPEFAMPEFTPVSEEVVERKEEVLDFQKSEEEAGPIFYMPQMDDVPSFAMPTENVEVTMRKEEEVVTHSVTEVENPVENAGATTSTRNLDEMFKMGQKKLLELLKMDNQLTENNDFSR